MPMEQKWESAISTEITRYFNSFSKSTELKPSVKVSIDGDNLLEDSQMKQFLIVSFRVESRWAEHAKRSN